MDKIERKSIPRRDAMRKRFTTVLMVLALLYALTLTAFAAGPNGTLSVHL